MKYNYDIFGSKNVYDAICYGLHPLLLKTISAVIIELYAEGKAQKLDCCKKCVLFTCV